MSEPRLSVVIPSHGRPLRLRWLLNALEDQTLRATEWEAVVVHDYDSSISTPIIGEHPLAQAGRLRHVAIAPGTGSPSRQRNIGWREAQAPLIAFTDDDCRPDARWLERLMAHAEQHPGAFFQGTAEPDPFEADIFAAPHVRTLASDPPNRFAQTCNALYPRELLAQIGGFDESLLAGGGEDIDLAIRARQAGAAHLGAPDAVVYHAVEALTLARALREDFKWRHLAGQLRRHPELRRTCAFGVFWEPEHGLVLLALAGLLGARRRPVAAALLAPWLVREGGKRGRRPTELAVNGLELPGRAVRELGRVVTFAAGSVQQRAFVL